MNIERKNLPLLYAGKLVSSFGTRIFSFALSFYILSTTGSGMQFSISLAINYLPPILLAPIAGAMNDKVSKRNTIVISDFLCAAIIFIPLLTSLSIWGLYLTSLLLSFVSVFFSNAMDSFVPTLVNADNANGLKQASSVLQMVNAASGITAPLIGGALMGILSMPQIVFISSSAFFVSAISELFITPDSPPKRVNEPRTAQYSLLESLRYLLKEDKVLTLTIIECALNFSVAFSIVSLLPFVVVREWGMSSTMLGVFNSMAPLGTITASFLFLQKKKNRLNQLSFLKITRYLCILLLLYSIILFIGRSYVDTPLFLCLCVIQIGYGVMSVSANITITATKQETIPKSIMAKTLGISHAIAMIMVPIGLPLSGFLAGKIDSFLLPLLGTVVVFAVLLVVSLRLQRQSRSDNYQKRRCE